MLNVMNVGKMKKAVGGTTRTQKQPHRSKTNTVKTPQIQPGPQRPVNRPLKKTPKRP